VSRAAAVALLDAAGVDESILPPVETGLTWWTIAVDLGDGADRYLSAMDQLRDERWVFVSASPQIMDRPPHPVACVHRRLSEAEAAELRRPS
jgi:hypothetical protein